MSQVESKDGTIIVFDKSGSGPAVILVSGATMTRSAWPDLANLLSPHFTVYSYDRRGRGDSTDTLPFSLDREIQDIDALIADAGGASFLYGISSGACLALQATAKLGAKVRKLAIYEAPYSTAPGVKQAWHEYRKNLTSAITAGRNGDAIKLFMELVGVPPKMIAGMQQSPMWDQLVAVAPTLAYDAEAMGPDREPPLELASSIKVPALVMDGGASLETMPFMRATADALAKAMSKAQHTVIPGQAHDVDPEALAPVLIDFFNE